MWAYVENNEVKTLAEKLPKNGADGVNLYSLRVRGNLYDNQGNIVIEDHDFGIDYDALKERGWHEVIESDAPEYDQETQQKPICDYSIIDGQVKQVWTISKKTDEQIVKEMDTAWEAIRAQRDSLLTASDWTQLADSSCAEAWQPYRQQLRDIPQLYVTPQEVVWPEKPTI